MPRNSAVTSAEQRAERLSSELELGAAAALA
eukprot:COSAG01_NODE_67044_length_268_cov_0.615385_1_plen_30_part_10